MLINMNKLNNLTKILKEVLSKVQVHLTLKEITKVKAKHIVESSIRIQLLSNQFTKKIDLP